MLVVLAVVLCSAVECHLAGSGQVQEFFNTLELSLQSMSRSSVVGALLPEAIAAVHEEDLKPLGSECLKINTKYG